MKDVLEGRAVAEEDVEFDVLVLLLLEVVLYDCDGIAEARAKMAGRTRKVENCMFVVVTRD